MTHTIQCVVMDGQIMMLQWPAMIGAILLNITVSYLLLSRSSLISYHFIKQGLWLQEVVNLVFQIKFLYFRIQCVLEMNLISLNALDMISIML